MSLVRCEHCGEAISDSFTFSNCSKCGKPMYDNDLEEIRLYNIFLDCF